MPCLCSFARNRSVEGATSAERLAAAHTVHADTARLTAFQNNITALRAFDLLDKDTVTLAEMRRDVFALSLLVRTLRTQRLAILSCF
jgi:hypothetical protein